MARVVIRVISSLLHDVVAPAAPRGGIPAAFILLEGDIYVVLGGDVPLIIPISEVTMLADLSIFHIVQNSAYFEG